MPEGADTVAHVEITDAGSENVHVLEPLRRGTNIRRRGEDMHAGDLVLADGTPIHAAEIGVIAGVQKPVVRVGRRPTVAILSTGDEIIDVGDAMAYGKVVNSNSYSLAALVRETMRTDPFSGVVYVFRAKRADRVKLIFWDGTGVVLVAKRLENGRFSWPAIDNGVMRLSAAQLQALLEGLDWRRVHEVRRTAVPAAAS